MNNLVYSEYDSFEKEKTIRLKEPISTSIIDNTLELQDIRVAFSSHQKGENAPEILLVGLFTGNPTEIREILIKWDDEEIKNYNLVVNSSSGCCCDITVADLKKICEAQKIEIRIKNSDGHADFTSDDIQFGAQVIYNASVDENAYMEEIQRREKEKEEKQDELERAKRVKIEKFNQQIARITNYGVNKFFSVDYDQFKQRLTVQIKETVELKKIKGTLELFELNIGFRFVYIKEKKSVLLIDIEAISKAGLNLKNGELLFLLDQTKRLSLQPHESYSEPYLREYHIESDWFEITEEGLKAICEASVIEMRVTNGDEYHDLETEELQVVARRFYNAIIDDTAYTDDLLTQEERDAAECERQHQEYLAEQERDAAERERQHQEYLAEQEREAAERELQRQEYLAEQERLRKEREAKEAEEARIRAEKRAEWWRKNGKKVRISIICIVVIIASAIGAYFAYSTVQTKRAVAQAEAYIASGDSCVAVYNFDEAENCYKRAYSCVQSIDGINDVRNNIRTLLNQLRLAKEQADKDYDEALRKLKIFLDADDYKFNQYSNECLDKMIHIYPTRKETEYYQNLRNK